MSFRSTLCLLTCVTTMALSAPLAQDRETVAFQERDPAAIQAILESLLSQSVTLKEHREQQHPTKTKNLLLLKESIHLVADDTGEEFVVYSETIYDPSAIKVVSYFEAADDKTTKLLLSLLGGGSVKSITITKPRSSKA